ncbi:MAG TPA: cytochrome c peroxidase [Acidimicrobiales bacterium]|nr:cytochrome c peroxidase [Acidimicrobiales bacterium]
MRRYWGVALVIVAAALFAACSSRGPKSTGFGADPHGDSGLSKAKMSQLLNAVQTATASISQGVLVEEGRKLFESTTLSKAGQSCATCHPSGGGVNMAAGIIHHPTKPGDFTGPRTPIPLWGVTDTAPYTWDGHVATLSQQVTNTVLSFFTAGKTQPADVTAKQAAAILAYISTLKPPATASDNGTMSALAIQGQVLFNNVGCGECHSGPFFTDNRIHVLGVPQADSLATDPGNPAVPGGFNTPALRDVKSLAPYMHNGVFADLPRVLDFYSGNREVGIRQLTGPEKQAIVEFLMSL